MAKGFFTLLLILLSLAISANAVPLKKGNDIRNCDSIKSNSPSEWNKQVNLYMIWHHDDTPNKNYRIIIYLRENNGCRPILYTWATNAKFEEKEGAKYPDIDVIWFHDNKKYQTVFTWQKDKYMSNEFDNSIKTNKDALELFNEGKLNEAISVWKQALHVAAIPDYGVTSNAEVLNNLGFAYYKLAKQTGKKEDFETAEKYMHYARGTDPARWIVSLNLGDLYSTMGKFSKAIESYRRLLKLNPDYPNAKKIVAIISKLEDGMKQKTISFKVHKKLPILAMRLYFEEDGSPYRMSISQKNGVKKQMVNIYKENCEPTYEDNFTDIAEDINFDGYKDIKLRCSSGVNENYIFYLYNPIKAVFELNNELTVVSNPVPNPKTKEIESYSRISGNVGQYDTYRFIDGKLTLIRQKTTSYNETDGELQYEEDILERKNGEMVPVRGGKSK